MVLIRRLSDRLGRTIRKPDRGGSRDQGGSRMDRMNRRKFLKVSGSAAVAGVGIEGILAARRAPAYAQGTKLHLLRWNDFVPAADEVLAKQMPEASKALGAEVTLERINANDLQARITAAISSGSGPDIIHVLRSEEHTSELQSLRHLV